MAFVETTALRKLLDVNRNGNRIHGVQGGTSASKTISIEQILIDKAQSDELPTLTSITSESMPHLKRGCIRDFKNILQSHNYWDDRRWNATDFIYQFPYKDIHGKSYPNGSQIEFFSLDQPHKVRGPRRKRLFVNELNNIPKETFDQLEVRTEDEIWADWNPVEMFYYHEDIMKRDDADLTILTYKDNEGLSESIVKSIESRKDNAAWWRVYGLGLPGEVEGRIYTGWQIIDDIPHEARRVSRGLDFGYARDPAVLVDIFFYNGGYILDEMFYRTGMTNQDIGTFINNSEAPQTLVIADGAEPKSIDELKIQGIAISSSEKGQGVVSRRIDHVKSQRISITKRSTNLIKSYRNYMWKTNKDGNILSIPDHFWSDGMDAVGYGLESQRPREEVEPVYEPSKFDGGFYL